MTDEEIKKSLIQTLEDSLDGVNQSCCNPKVLSLDKTGNRCTIELDLHIVEEDNFAGFEGY